MTKEQLEELIEQGATIWSNTMWYHGKIYLANTDTDKYTIKRSSRFGYLLKHHKKGTNEVYDSCWGLEDLREDVERAEWEYKMTAERTERFEPPMWEDIEDKYCFSFCENFGKYGDLYILDINKYCNINWAITVEKNSDIIFSGTATKENYEKACEMVRDLFKGENNGKNAQEK